MSVGVSLSQLDWISLLILIQNTIFFIWKKDPLGVYNHSNFLKEKTVEATKQNEEMREKPYIR
jgi:hypothetical protein